MDNSIDDICLAFSLRRADRVVSQIYNEQLASVGLRNTQFSVLHYLNYCGSTTAAQIQKSLVMDQTTVSRALKPLIRDGYIIVSEGVTKREKALALSPAGQSLYGRARVRWLEAQKILKSKLKNGSKELIIALSREIADLKS